MTAAGQVRSEIVSRLKAAGLDAAEAYDCLLYTSPSPRD